MILAILNYALLSLYLLAMVRYTLVQQHMAQALLIAAKMMQADFDAGLAVSLDYYMNLVHKTPAWQQVCQVNKWTFSRFYPGLYKWSQLCESPA